tara:strand:+ start:1196 stop:1369 length:174 start_codon:yes stop_codon:yes gene_type:complete
MNIFNKIQLAIEKKTNSVIVEINKIYLNTLLYKSINMTAIEYETSDSWNYYEDINYL